MELCDDNVYLHIIQVVVDLYAFTCIEELAWKE